MQILQHEQIAVAAVEEQHRLQQLLSEATAHVEAAAHQVRTLRCGGLQRDVETCAGAGVARGETGGGGSTCERRDLH